MSNSSLNKKKEKVKTIIIDASLVEMLLKTLDPMLVRRCIYCEEKITPKNFGGVNHNGYVCDNLIWEQS